VTATEALTSTFARGIPEGVKATKISGCDESECPAVYATDEPGVVLAQGTPVAGVDGVRLGPGEMAVKLPLSVLRDAVARLEGAGS